MNNGKTKTWLDHLDAHLPPILRVAIWAALFQLLLLAYWPALEAPFVYDDIQCIVLNSELRSPVEISRFFSNHRTSMQFDHRPLVGIATMVNYQIAGLNVVPYRIFNLLIHWSVAVVLGEFIISLARHFQLSGGKRLGFLVAVFWALHPLNTVTVIFISQRMESLMVLFYLLALWSLLKAGREGDYRYLTGALLATIASLASKEVGVTLVASLLMLDRVCHFTSWKELLKRRLKFYLIQFLVAAVFITWWTSGERLAELRGAVLSDSWLYFQTQCRVIVSYVAKVLWPNNLVFVAAPRPPQGWSDWLPFALVITISFGLCAWVARHGRPWVWIPAILFFFVLGPTSSFLAIPQEPEAEWRMYFPSACLLVLLVAGLSHSFVRLELPKTFVLLFFVGVGLALLVASRERAKVYRSSVSLWRDNVVKDPDSVKAWANLGIAHYQEKNMSEVGRVANGLWQMGLEHQSPVTQAKALQMSAWIEKELGQFSKAEELLKDAISLSSERGYFTDLAQVLLAQGKPEEASGYLKTVLADDPQDFMTLILYGEALIRCGNATEGEEILKQGERIAPDASPLQEVRKRLQQNRN